MLVILYLSGFAVHRVLQTTFKSVPANSSFGTVAGAAFKQGAFRDLVISFAATYAMYFICSFLYGEPWHMFTSMIQYLMLLPSFINILNVYAFCNLHDISWGTKGDNTVSDLGSVTAIKGKDGKQTVEIDFPSDRNEIARNYELFIRGMAAPKDTTPQKRDAKTKQEDYFKNFRTKTVLAWAFTNALLIVLLFYKLLQLAN